MASAACSEAFALPAYLMAPEVHNNKVMAEYIWLGSGGHLRSKTKVLDAKPAEPADAPVLAVYTCGNPEMEGGDVAEEVFLRPRKVFRDPFRGGDHILILCDTFQPAQADVTVSPVVEPCESNTRVACENVMKVAEPSQPVLAGEQQYAIIHPAYPTVIPLGPAKRRRASARSSARTASVAVPVKQPASWPPSAFSGTLSASLHSFGSPPVAANSLAGSLSSGGFGPPPPGAAIGRTMSESHLRCCLFAGVNVTGADAAGPPGVSSYKVGPCSGVDFGDQVWASRYLLQRVAEDHGAAVSWQPDAMPGGPPLSLCVKYSTADTRDPSGGIGAIQQQLGKLQTDHLKHLAAYHSGRMHMLAAAGGQAPFTHAVGTCGAAVTVPTMTLMRQGGYYVDRRPPADADPYVAAMLLASSTLDVPLPSVIPTVKRPQQQPAFSAGLGCPGEPFSHASSFGMMAPSGSALCGSGVAPAVRPYPGRDADSDVSYDEADDDDGACSETNTMDTEGSYDLLLDELQRMDGAEDGEDASGASDGCGSDEECSSDGTSPDRSWALVMGGYCSGAVDSMQIQLPMGQAVYAL